MGLYWGRIGGNGERKCKLLLRLGFRDITVRRADQSEKNTET